MSPLMAKGPIEWAWEKVLLGVLAKGSQWLSCQAGPIEFHGERVPLIVIAKEFQILSWQKDPIECQSKGVTLSAMPKGSHWISWQRGHIVCHGKGVTLSVMPKGSHWMSWQKKDHIDCHVKMVPLSWCWMSHDGIKRLYWLYIMVVTNIHLSIPFLLYK